MKSEIKLVILAPGFATDENDSTAFPALQLFLANLHSLYPETAIRLVTFFYPFRRGNYNWKGIDVYAAGGFWRKPMKFFFWIRMLFYLLRLKREEGIDIIHTFWLSDTTLIGLFFGWMTGIPVITTAMGQDVKKQNRYLWLIRLFKPVIITISDLQSNILLETGTTPLKMIPFGIDLSYYRHEQDQRGIDILAAGSLNKIKNHIQFVEIIRSLAAEFPGLKCGIAGDGKEREEIKRFIHTNKLEKQIVLFGQLPYNKVIEKMRQSKILLHTSSYEGQGLVLTEALAAGAYVVCYPVGTAWNRADKKLRTGTTNQELRQHLIDILMDPNQDFSPEIFYNIEDTCSEYNEIYHTFVLKRSYDNHS
jgi:glycosyltransferase involved in cell wall biosynthesis